MHQRGEGESRKWLRFLTPFHFRHAHFSIHHFWRFVAIDRERRPNDHPAATAVATARYIAVVAPQRPRIDCSHGKIG
jgi:hypothetical protein